MLKRGAAGTVGNANSIRIGVPSDWSPGLRTHAAVYEGSLLTSSVIIM